jgi:hypothetical protein
MSKKSARGRGGASSKQPPIFPGRPLNSNEAAAYLTCTLRTLHTYRLQGLPFFKLNGRVFKYYERDLERWLMRQSV